MNTYKNASNAGVFFLLAPAVFLTKEVALSIFYCIWMKEG